MYNKNDKNNAQGWQYTWAVLLCTTVQRNAMCGTSDVMWRIEYRKGNNKLYVVTSTLNGPKMTLILRAGKAEG